MHVAFVYPNPRAGLAEEVARGEAPDTALLGQNHLHELGIDAVVHDSAVRRKHLTAGPLHRATWLLREATIPWELREADVVVTPLATLLPLIARLRRRRPRIVLLSWGIVSLWRRSGLARRRLIAASLRASDRVVALAASAQPELAAIGRVAETHVEAVPFGVDADFWKPAEPAADGIVLSVGRDLARDYRTLGAALEGSSRHAVLVAKQENVAGLRLPANVEVKMHIPTDELRSLYARAACVVLPLVPDGDPRGTESSGNTAVLEAMACGHAPIVTERASLRDYISPGVATTVPPNDPVALRRAIDGALADHPRAVAMGAAARRHIENGFTTRDFAERLARVLREVA